MKKLILLISLLGMGASAFAEYDRSWYKDDFWSGEYPMGVSVYKKELTIKGRVQAEATQAATVNCTLPYLANIQQWNTERLKRNDINFLSYTKIEKITARDNINYLVDSPSRRRLVIKKGEVAERLAYLSEGYYKIRFKGKIYDVDFGIMEKFIDESPLVEDRWFRIKCENGVTAWIFLNDLGTMDPETGEMNFINGLAMGSFEEYGSSRDLTETEAAELRRQNP